MPEPTKTIETIFHDAWAIAVATAFHERDPRKAAEFWACLSKLCHLTSEILRKAGNTKHLDEELRDLLKSVNDYKKACDERCIQNLNDSQVGTPPTGLFPPYA
jgi:hypothetical protein